MSNINYKEILSDLSAKCRNIFVFGWRWKEVLKIQFWWRLKFWRFWSFDELCIDFLMNFWQFFVRIWSFVIQFLTASSSNLKKSFRCQTFPPQTIDNSFCSCKYSDTSHPRQLKHIYNGTHGTRTKFFCLTCCFNNWEEENYRERRVK